MEESHEQEIEKIISQTSCPKGFTCYKKGFHSLCKAKDVGLESHVQCLDSNSNGCAFSVRYGYSYYCRCPLRVYVAKNLGK